MENWIVLDETLLSAWTREATRRVSETVGSETAVSLRLPTEEEARTAWKHNLTLAGAIAFRFPWNDVKEFPLPLPYHGVFILHGDDPIENRPRLAVWNSYLLPEDRANPDRDDLSHRLCQTFPVALLRRLETFCRKLCVAKAANMGNPSGTDEWEVLASALVPTGKLARVAPENILDLAGRIFGVRRFRFTREQARRIPAQSRENHPSFAGRLCPIETPESETVGLQLQLARGARVDADGRIHPSEAPADGSMLPFLGWGASLVPFLHHDDDARTMMGAKNMRQAVRVLGAEPPAVRSGGERMLVEAMQPIVSAGLCTDGATAAGDLALGRDLLVAYLPWYGWNVDDAVVVCEDVCGPMSETETKEFATEVDPAWKLSGPLAKSGKSLTRGAVIATFEKGGKTHRIVYADEAPGTLSEISFPEHLQPEESGTLRYKVTRTFPLGLGDKLMGRHGNKGVVARVLRREEMPRLPDGTVVDILLNPHGVLSRRNPGQLLETHVGWLLHRGVKESSLLARGSELPLGAPARGLVDHAKVRACLQATGLDACGAVKLSWTDAAGGTHETENPVVVGYQHFFRLHHIPEQKAQARRGGKSAHYAFASGQAAHGRAIGGGQRFGEMETWALAAYPGSAPILAELLAQANAVGTRAGKPGKLGDSGFAQTLADLLTALCIKTNYGADGVRFSRMTDGEIRALNAKPLTRANALSRRSAVFHCGENVKRLAFGGRRFTWHDSKCTSLTLESLLAAFGWRIAGPLDSVHRLPVGRIGEAETVRLSVMPLNRGKAGRQAKTLSVEIFSDDAAFAEFLPVRCWQKVGGKIEGGTAGDLFAAFASEDGARGIGAMHVLCPCETCRAKKPNEAVKLVPACLRDEASTGGVCDAAIFGAAREAFVARADERWGLVELPAPVAYPLKGAQDVTLNVLPVLPLRYRMPHPVQPDPFGYGDVVAAAARVTACQKDGVDEDMLAKAQKALEKAVGQLFQKLSERFSGKRGLVRHDGLGRRVDRSCRLVLTPNPELAMDEVGVPTSVLWELVGDRILNARVTVEGQALSVDNRERVAGTREIGWGWHSPDGAVSFPLAKRHAILEKFLAERAEPLRLLVNRQPSLHKYNLQSFRIRALAPSAGEVFALSPLCFRGFAADCDGDEFTGFLPLAEAAQSALAALSPAANLVSDANGETLANYDRDFVTGSVLEVAGGSGRVALPRDREKAKERILALSRAGDAARLADAARRAFVRCTETGVSFGFYDLMDLAAASTPAAAEGAGARFVTLLTESGANGAKQLPQIFESLVGGMDWAGVFENSFGARSSMCDKKLCTGKAGDLTRRLVYALRPCRVVCDDCGHAPKTGGRSVLTCRAKDGVCARCYGCLADGASAPVGYPAGLVAAQFIGERGTQLSMKSAQAGGRQVDIESVRNLILRLHDGKTGEWTCRDFQRFEEFLRDTGRAGTPLPAASDTPYAQLDRRHLQILWRVLCDGAKVRPLAKVLQDVDKARNFESLARSANRAALAAMVTEGLGPIPLDTPAAQVMFGGEARS